MTNKIWTIADVLQWMTEHFKSKGIESPRLDAELLLADVLQRDRLYLYTHRERPLDEAERARLREYTKRRAEGYCVAAIVGYTEFMGVRLQVNRDVLIPRPETETLVEAILSVHGSAGERKVIDVGTGSGAILLSLLHARPQWTGIGIDISPQALAVAKHNGEQLGLADRCRWLNGDLLAPLAEEQADILVSNPPYICTDVIPELAPEVQHEPHRALDGGPDGLDFYRRLVTEAWKYVKPGGLVAVEIGADQGQAVSRLVRENPHYDAPVLYQDYGQRDRVILWETKR